MKTLRILPLAALSLAVGLMTSCDSTSSTSGPTIKEFQISNTDGTSFDEAKTALPAGSSVSVYGEVKSDAALATVEVVVTNACGTVVDDIKNSTSSTDYVFGSDKSAKFTIISATTWSNGAYTVKLIATDANGNVATSSTLPLTISGGAAACSGGSTTPLSTSTQLSIGGFNASAHSFIGLSPIQTYPGTQSTSNVSKIDLVFNANADGSGEVLESPYYAYHTTQDLINDAWANGRATTIAKVSTAPTTLEAAKAIALTAQTVSVTSASDIFVAKTQDNVYAVIKFSSLTGVGDNATATITVLEQ